MAYRLGDLTVDDPEFGTITLQGDGFAAAGEVVTLIVSPDVQSHLHMSPEEVSRASEIADNYRERLKQVYTGREWRAPHLEPAASPARRELESRAAALLGRDRTERLRKLSWRLRPGDALLEDDVADTLGLAADQRVDVARIAEANEAASQDVLREIRSVRLRSHDAVEAKGREADEQCQERLLARLTAEQRERFERLREGSR